MEPIRLWRIYCDGWNYTDDEEVSKIGEPLVALPRAEYDALVKRDRTCPLCGDELDPDEADYDSVCPPAGAGVCSRCFGRWYDAPLYEKRAAAATARAEKAEALLRTLRGWLDINERAMREAEVGCPTLLARIDALLSATDDAPTPDDRPTEADRRGEDGA